MSRDPQGQYNRPKKKAKVKEQLWKDASEAIYKCEGDLRVVAHHEYSYNAFAKGRWYGREIFQVMTEEFVAYKSGYYRRAITDGRIRVNGEKVTCEYVFKDGDFMAHLTHRHEIPVYGQVTFTEVGDVVVVHKPSSMPVHPSGRYHYNSLVYILAHDHGLHLHPIHRLDRLTSGLCIFAKDGTTAARVSKLIRERDVKKYYVARVRGKFPLGEKEQLSLIDSVKSITEQDCIDRSWIKLSAPIKCASHKLAQYCVDTEDTEAKESETWFRRLSYDTDSNTSVVLCSPVTGRTHQIRVHLLHLNHPIANDPCYGGVLCRGNRVPSALSPELTEWLTNYKANGCDLCESGFVDENKREYCKEIWLCSIAYTSTSSSTPWQYTVEVPEWSKSQFEAKQYLIEE